MSNNNFGYACVNMQLSNPKKYFLNNAPKVICNRSMIKRTFLDRGLPYASKLSLDNCKDLIRIIEWNYNNGFKFFRMSSDLLPWASEYNLSDLPDYDSIKSTLIEAGRLASLYDMRITSHPGPFNVLTSPKKHVVDNCIKDLSIQGEVFDMMNLSRTPYNKINIHIGGAYGDKKQSMKRFCDNFLHLPYSVKSRLTVENDDRESMYSVKDLYDSVYLNIAIPIVFDYHHHKFCNGGLTEKEALNLAISTWGNIKPVIHYSESRSVEKNNNEIKPQAHSDYIYNYIDTYGNNIDIMVEAKHKELAVLKYLNNFNYK